MCFSSLRAQAAGFVVLGALTSGAAQGAERLHMPFDCYFDGFQVQLEPSEDRSYEIVGPRERDILTVCAPYDPGRCRSWNVHRFEFQCGGTRVSWVDAALAGARMTGRDVWLEDDRVHIRMGPMWTIARHRPWRSRRRLRDMPSVNTFDPAEFGGARGPHVVTAPPGFAPAFGIPVAFSAAEPGFAADEPFVENEPSPSEQVRTAQAPAVAAYEEPAPLPPVPELPERAPSVRPKPVATEPSSTPSAQTAEAETDASMATGTSASVKTASESAAQPETERVPAKSPGFTIINAPGAKRSEPKPPPAPSPTPVKAADVSEPVPSDEAAKPTTQVVAVQETTGSTATISDDADTVTATQLQAPAISKVQPASREDAADIASATAAAAAVFALAGLAFFGLRRWGRAGPDSEVQPLVARDLGAISLDVPGPKKHLSPAPTAEPQPSRAADKAGIAFDFDVPIPTNYTQALHVLGASADASTDAIKKIVDGLRKSWHPDLARSEADRLYREKRARQINVAWDLVSKRRTTPA